MIIGDENHALGLQLDRAGLHARTSKVLTRPKETREEGEDSREEEEEEEASMEENKSFKTERKYRLGEGKFGGSRIRKPGAGSKIEELLAAAGVATEKSRQNLQ